MPPLQVSFHLSESPPHVAPPPIKFCPYLRMNIANTQDVAGWLVPFVCYFCKSLFNMNWNAQKSSFNLGWLAESWKCLKEKKLNNTYTIQNLYPITTTSQKQGCQKLILNRNSYKTKKKQKTVRSISILIFSVGVLHKENKGTPFLSECRLLASFWTDKRLFYILDFTSLGFFVLLCFRTGRLLS